MNQLQHLIISILASLLSSILLAQAPVTLWTKTYGTAGGEVLYSIDQTTDGGFIMSGTFGFGTNIDDYWLVRTNAQGDTLWTRTYGNPGENNMCRSGQLTNDGGYIMAGLGTMWLIKTNADGDTLWTRRSGGFGGEEAPWVEQTADSGYIITGNINNDVGLIKTDSLGNAQWTQTYGGLGDEYGRSVQQTADGGYIIVADRSVDQGPVDIWLLKTDANGDTTSTWTFATGSGGGSDVVRQTADGGYAIFGIIFGTLGSPAPEGGDRDWLLIKTNSLGELQWSRTYGGDEMDQSMGMLLTDDGGFLLTGWLDLTASGNSMDLWLVKTDASGFTVWDTYVGGTGMDIGMGLAQIAEGVCAVAGGTGSWGAGGFDGWLVRFATPFEQDSLALVALYDSTDGDNWTYNSGWKTGPVSGWYGVNVVGGRVAELGLTGNNLSGPIPPQIGDLTSLSSLSFIDNELTGEIPAEIGNLTNLQYLALYSNQLTGAVPTEMTNLTKLRQLYISYNQLVDLPDLSGLTSLIGFNVNNNRLTFEDIEPNIGIPDFDYSGQDSIGSRKDTTLIVGNSLTLSVSVGGSANVYQWLKDSVPLAGATADTYSIPSVALDNTGVYSVEVTNTIAEDLTLYSRPTSVTVILEPFEADSLALVALYDSTGGASWSASTNWITTAALSDWYGVTVSGGRVTALDLHENNLSGSVPVGIGDLSALTSLKLYRNQLTSIPEEIGSLTSLTELWLMENDLTTVPAGIGGLVNLEDLQLSENQLTDLPAEIGDLVSLESLSLFENPFTAIPSGIFDLTTLTQLDLYECEIAGAVPAGIGGLINLTHLSLYTNQLDSIPTEIGNLINLSYLDLANNLLASIPSEIGDLASLTDLRLNGNELDSIPTTIGNLTNLEMLYLYSNGLDSLPSQLANLSNLRALELSDNRFTILPGCITSLDTLGWLLMSDNGLTSLPAAITDLAYLNSLNVGNNELEDLPDLSPLDSLTDLRIYGNQLTFDDLEPLMTLGIGYIYYDSQDSIGTAVDTTVTIGTSLALGITTGGSANHYEWKKNAASTVGTDNDTLYFESITESDGGFYNCYVTNTTVPDLILCSLPFNVSVTPLAIDDKPAIPEEYALHANYPNPFNPSTTIRYDLPEAVELTLLVYDLLGREVVRLVDSHREAGYHRMVWNGRDGRGRAIPTGVYIARLIAPEFSKSIKLVLLK